MVADATTAAGWDISHAIASRRKWSAPPCLAYCPPHPLAPLAYLSTPTIHSTHGLWNNPSTVDHALPRDAAHGVLHVACYNPSPWPARLSRAFSAERRHTQTMNAAPTSNASSASHRRPPLCTVPWLGAGELLPCLRHTTAAAPAPPRSADGSAAHARTRRQRLAATAACRCTALQVSPAWTSARGLHFALGRSLARALLPLLR